MVRAWAEWYTASQAVTRPSTSRKKTVEAEAEFVLCQEDSCRPVKEKVTLAVEVTSPQAAPAKRPGKKK